MTSSQCRKVKLLHSGCTHSSSDDKQNQGGIRQCLYLYIKEMNVKQIQDLLEFTDHTACSKEQTKSESHPHNIVVHHTVITLQRSKQKSCYKSLTDTSSALRKYGY